MHVKAKHAVKVAGTEWVFGVVVQPVVVSGCLVSFFNLWLCWIATPNTGITKQDPIFYYGSRPKTCVCTALWKASVRCCPLATQNTHEEQLRLIKHAQRTLARSWCTMIGRWTLAIYISKKKQDVLVTVAESCKMVIKMSNCCPFLFSWILFLIVIGNGGSKLGCCE